MDDLPFSVRRPCPDGFCPASDGGPCECLDPIEPVDVDELTFGERAFFRGRGTDEQRALVAAYWTPDPAELAAGRPDPERRLA